MPTKHALAKLLLQQNIQYYDISKCVWYESCFNLIAYPTAVIIIYTKYDIFFNNLQHLRNICNKIR